jgi:hypothetical protein
MRFTGKKFALVIVSVVSSLASFAQSISTAHLANKIEYDHHSRAISEDHRGSPAQEVWEMWE